MSLAPRSARRSARNLSLSLAVAAAIAGVSMVNTASAAWIGASSGATQNGITFRYDRLSNWAGGTFDDTFSGASVTGNLTLYFGSDYATAGNMTFNYTGNSNLTLLGGSTADGLTAANRTLTLNGDVFYAPTTGGALTFGTTTANQNLNVNLNGTRIFYAGDNTSLSRTITFTNVVSNGSLIKSGIGILNFSAANTYTGPTVTGLGTANENGGNNRITLQNNGTLASSDIFVLHGSRLRLDTQSTALNRLVDTAAVTLNQGRFEFQASPAATNITMSETFGKLNFSGVSQFAQGYSSVPGTSNTVLISTTFELNRIGNGVLIVTNNRADANNADSNASVGQLNSGGTTSHNKIVLTNTSSLLVGGGGGAGTTTVSIIPYVIGAETPVAVGGNNLATPNAKTFYTYDNTAGLRPLARSEYKNTLVGAGTTENVRLGASATVNTTTDINGSGQINALVLSDDVAGGTLSLTNTLTVGSGAILITNTGGNWIVSGGSIRFGTVGSPKEGLIMVAGARGATISSSLLGSQGATFVTSTSGSATTLNADTSGLTGTLRFLSHTASASQININNSNSIVGQDVVIGGIAEVRVGVSGAITSRMNLLTGGSENAAGIIGLNDGVGATVGNIDKVVIGGSGAVAGATAGRITLDGGTISAGMVSDGTSRWTRLGYLQLRTQNNTTGLDVKSGTIAIDLGEATGVITRTAPTNTSLKGVSDRIVVTGDINLATAATVKLSTWTGSGAGAGSYLIATATGGVTTTTALSVNSTDLGSTVRAKVDSTSTAGQIWVDVINTANPSALAASVGTFSGSGSSYSLDFGSRLTTDPALTSNLTISNLLRQAGITLQDGLKITGWTVTGDSVFSGLSGLPTIAAGTANGGIGSVTFTSAGATAGNKTGQLTINLAGSTAGWTDQALTSYIISLAGQVQSAGLTATTYTLGTTQTGTLNVLKGGTLGAGDAVITNTGDASADSLNYTGLAGSTDNGAVATVAGSSNGGPVANQNGTASQALTVAGVGYGSTTITASVSTATNNADNSAATFNGPAGSFSVNVGNAQVGPGNTFGTALSGVSTGAALSSITSNTEATAIGIDNGNSVTMDWRSPTVAEDQIVQGDIVRIDTVNSDIYVLKLTYGSDTNESQLFLGKLIGSDFWSTAGNELLYTKQFDFNYDQGAVGLNDDLGRWGIDTTNNFVWAVVQGDGTFAVIPEPTSLGLLGLGAVGLLLRRRK